MKYYNAVGDYTDKKPFHPIYNALKKLVRLFFPKNEVIWKTEKPPESEPLFFVCNHTKIYAPVYYLLQKKTVRPWANFQFLFKDDCFKHIKNRICIGKRKWLLPLGWLLTPLIIKTFRATEPIPVYHKTTKVFTDTFGKSIQTMEEGTSQVIFPERTENQVNKYIFQFNHGFPTVAEIYYKKTGKLMKFYPVYCAQSLHTFVIGEPVTYDPSIPMATQKIAICEYLQDKVKELGDSLPEHKIVLYG